MLSAYDELALTPGGAGDAERTRAVDPPLPYEAPEDTAARQESAARTGQRAFAATQVMKAGDFARRNMPAFTDYSTGDVKPVTDATGAPLTGFDKKNQIAWDSTGQPKKISYDEKGPVLSDPFEGIPPVTDKRGDKYQIAPGLPWKAAGEDVDVKAANLARDQDKAVAQASLALGRKLSIDERQTHRDEVAFRHGEKEFDSNFGPIDYEDPDTTRATLEKSFDEQYKAPEANAKAGFFSKDLSPEAQNTRADIDQRKAKALQHFDNLVQTRQTLDQRRAAIDQAANVRDQLEMGRAQQALGRARSAGVIPGLDDEADQASTPKQQPTAGTGGPVSGAQSASTPSPSLLSTPSAQGGEVDQSLGDSAVIPGLSEAQKKSTDPAQHLAAAAAGQKPYQYDEKNGLQFTPDKLTEGLDQAVKDGVVDPQWAKEHDEAFKTAQAKYQDLQKAAGSAQVLKALLHGGGMGAAFLAGSAPGAALGAEVGSIGGPIGTGVGAVLGGLTTGTLASFAAKKGLEKLGEYSDAIKSLNAAAELHPVADASGEFVAFAASAPRALGKLANLGRIAGGGIEGAKAIGGQLAKGAAGGLAFEAIARPAFDAARYVAADQLGIEHDELRSPTTGSLATMVALGLLTAGHSLQFREYNAKDLASILTRAKVRTDAGIPLDAEVPVAEMAAAYKAKGVDLTSDNAQAMAAPLTREEIGLHKTLAEQTKAMEEAGAFKNAGVKFESAEQAVIPGLKKGGGTQISSAVIKAEPNGESPSEPAPEPPPAIEGPTAPPQKPVSGKVVDPAPSAPHDLLAERADLRQKVARTPTSQTDAALLAAEQMRLANVERELAATLPTAPRVAADQAAPEPVAPPVAEDRTPLSRTTGPDEAPNLPTREPALGSSGGDTVPASSPASTSAALDLQSEAPREDTPRITVGARVILPGGTVGTILRTRQLTGQPLFYEVKAWDGSEMPVRADGLKLAPEAEAKAAGSEYQGYSRDLGLHAFKELTTGGNFSVRDADLTPETIAAKAQAVRNSMPAQAKPAFRDAPKDLHPDSPAGMSAVRHTLSEDIIASASKTASAYDAPAFIGGNPGTGTSLPETPKVSRTKPSFVAATVHPNGRVELENGWYRPEPAQEAAKSEVIPGLSEAPATKPAKAAKPKPAPKPVIPGIEEPSPQASKSSEVAKPTAKVGDKVRTPVGRTGEVTQILKDGTAKVKGDSGGVMSIPAAKLTVTEAAKEPVSPWDLGDALRKDAPAKAEEAATEGIAAGQSVRLGKNPTVWTVAEKLPPAKGDQPDEAFYRVTNERGDEQVVESKDMQVVNRRDPAEVASEKATRAANEKELDQKLANSGYDVSKLPDLKSKRAAWKRHQALAKNPKRVQTSDYDNRPTGSESETQPAASIQPAGDGGDEEQGAIGPQGQPAGENVRDSTADSAAGVGDEERALAEVRNVIRKFHETPRGPWREKRPNEESGVAWMDPRTGEIVYDIDGVAKHRGYLGKDGDQWLNSALLEENSHQEDYAVSIAQQGSYGPIQALAWKETSPVVKSLFSELYHGEPSDVGNGAEIIRILRQIALGEPITEAAIPWKSDGAAKLTAALKDVEFSQKITRHLAAMARVKHGRLTAEPKGDGGGLRASLAESPTKQTETPEFKRWAGGARVMMDAHPVKRDFLEEVWDLRNRKTRAENEVQANEYEMESIPRQWKWIQANIKDPSAPTHDEIEKAMNLGIIPFPDPEAATDRYRRNLAEAKIRMQEAVTKLEAAESENARGKIETGKPIVARVFHATPRGAFEEFDDSLRGATTGAPSAGEGHFFSGTEDTAKAYHADEGDDLPFVGYAKLDSRTKSAVLNEVRESMRSSNEYHEERLRDLKREDSDLAMRIEEALDDDNYDEIHASLTGDEKQFAEDYKEAKEGAEHEPTLDEIREYALHNKGDVAELAEYVTGKPFDTTPIKNHTIEAFVRLKNPLVHDYDGERYREESYFNIIKKAKAAGHDGVILKNTYDGGPLDNIFVVFDAKGNVKSATGNSGAFDPANPNIRESLKEPQDMDVESAIEARDNFDEEDPETWPANLRESLDPKTPVMEPARDDWDTWTWALPKEDQAWLAKEPASAIKDRLVDYDEDTKRWTNAIAEDREPGDEADYASAESTANRLNSLADKAEAEYADRKAQAINRFMALDEQLKQPVRFSLKPVFEPKLREAYDRLVAKSRWQLPAVSIGELAKESGMPLADLKAKLYALHKQGRVVLSIGDWSLSSPETRAGMIDVAGQRMTQVRPLDVMSSAAPSDAVNASIEKIRAAAEKAPTEAELDAAGKQPTTIEFARPTGAGKIIVQNTREAITALADRLLPKQPKGHLQDIADAIEPMRQQIAPDLRIRILRNEADMPIAERQGMRATNVHEGVVDIGRGNVYIFADNISTPERARQVFLHEVVGHYGVEQLVGPEDFQKIADAVFKEAPGVARNIARQYAGKESPFHKSADFKDLTAAEKATVAREYVAKLAEKPSINPSLWQRILAMLRRALRRLGIVKEWSSADLRDLVRRAAKVVERPAKEATEDAGIREAMRDQTSTPEFKRWFGESKAVDAKGDPLVVYHGAPDARFIDDTGVFKTSSQRLREATGKESGTGVFWFTPSRDTARTYADDLRAFDYQNAEAGVVPAFLKLENPLIVDANGQNWRDAQRRGKTSDVIEQAMAAGHDGVIIRNVKDDYNNGARTRATDTYAVFDAKQIKHADRNIGAFDPENPDIRASIVDPIKGAYDSVAQEVAAGRNAIKDAPVKDRVKAGYDATGNYANMLGEQAYNQTRLDFEKPPQSGENRAQRLAREAKNKLDMQAARLVVEAGGDKNELLADQAKILAGKDPKLVKVFAPIVQHAITNFDDLDQKAGGHRALAEGTYNELVAAGEDVGKRDNYVRRVTRPPEDQSGTPGLFQMGSGQGTNPKGFEKGRSFNKIADAVEAGYDPGAYGIHDADQRMVEDAQRVIGGKAFLDEMRRTVSPTDGKPIVGKLEQVKKANGEIEAQVPKGYKMVQAGGTPIPIHKDFAGLFSDLFGTSALRSNAFLRGILKFEALAKHGTLVLDTFHVGRLLFKMAAGGGGAPVTMRGGKPAFNYHAGLALLETDTADLGRRVANGEISPQEARYVQANKPRMNRLVKSGINIGKVADNLLDQVRTHIPGISHLNDWIFRKVSRGVMAQTSLKFLDRNLKNPNLTEDQAYRQTAKEMNEYFSNLQNQGIFQSKTLQDVARVILLAPNWTEGQARYEGRAYAQAVKSAFNAVRGKGFRAGNSTRAFAAGFVALLAVNQLINYLTRNQSTFQNEEDGHKLDAWIPGAKRGFWFNPFEIAGEYAHAFEKYLSQYENPVDAATHIASNKLSPLARGVKEAATGRDAMGRHYLNETDRFRSAAVDALPSPLLLGAFMEKDPRQPLGYRATRAPAAIEKQLLQSVGAKVTPVQSPRTQMFALAHDYRADKGRSDVAGQYTELRRALDLADDTAALTEIQWLKKQGKSLEDIGHALGIKKDGSVTPERFTGGDDRERDMLAHLNAEQKVIYRQAQKEHVESARRFQKLAGQLPREMPKQKSKPAMLAAYAG